MEENSVLDKDLEKSIINQFIPITDLLDNLKIDYREDSNFFCPFHYNVDTPSAHLYLDPSDGGGKIWCYSEQRMYGSWDVIHQFNPKVNTNRLALAIINKLRKRRNRKKIRRIRIRQ